MADDLGNFMKPPYGDYHRIRQSPGCHHRPGRQLFGCPAVWGFIFQTSNVDINEAKSHQITDNLGCELPVCWRLLKILGYLRDDDFEWFRPSVLLQPKAIRCKVVPLGLCESFCAATFFRGTGTGAGTGIASRGAKHSLTMFDHSEHVFHGLKMPVCATESLSLSLVKFKHVGTKHHTLGMVTAIPLQQFLMLLFPRFETMSYRCAAVTKGCLWAACWAWFNKSKDIMNNHEHI